MRRNRYFIGTLLLASLASTCAWAHPHVLVVTSQTFVFDEDGLKEIQSEWRYDSYTSTDLFGIHDANADGELSNAETKELARELMKNLREHEFFTSLKANGKTRPVFAVKRAEASEDQYKISFAFTVPCRVDATDGQEEVRIAQYDPSYYVAFEYAEPGFQVVNADAFDWHIERGTNEEESFYGGAFHPEELVLRFARKGAPAKRTSVAATVPNGEKPEPGSPSHADSHGEGNLRGAIVAWLTKRQNDLKQRLEEVVLERGSDRPRVSAVFWLCFIAFAYGVLHAAGPGHGKVVTASYMVGEERRLSSGVLLGTLLAFFHGLSGIAVVLLGRFILEQTALASMGTAGTPLKVASFGMIALLGAAMLFAEFRQRGRDHGHNQGELPGVGSATNRSTANVFLLAMAAGLVPCPGVVLVMLFCSGSGHTLLGVLLAACVVAGMALTISAAGLLVAGVKKGALGRLSFGEQRAERIERALRPIAWSMVFVLGAVSLLLTLLGA